MPLTIPPNAYANQISFISVNGLTSNNVNSAIDETYSKAAKLETINTFIEQLIISNSTASTSKTTGALRVAGGAGIQGNVNIGGNLNLEGTATGLKLNTPTLVVRRVAAQNINHTTFTKILWDTTINDSALGINTSTGNYTVSSTGGGLYFCTARIVYASNVSRALLQVIANGTGYRLDDPQSTTDTIGYAGGSTLLVLNPGNTVYVEAYQQNTSSSSRATGTGQITHVEWSMFRVCNF